MLDSRRIAQAFRSLFHRPAYTLAAVLTLAVGIGAGTAIVSMLYGSQLRPLPYPEQHRLLHLYNTHQATGSSGPFSPPNHADLARENRTLEELVGYELRSLNLATESVPDRVQALAVTANFFDGLGLGPALGRGFEDGEDRQGAGRVAVIGHRVWQERFDGRRDVLGETLRLNGEIHTVVGVLDESFWFPGDPEIVVPFAWGEEDLVDARRGGRWVAAFGRVEPGVGEEAVRSDLDSLLGRIAERFPDNMEGWVVATAPFEEHALGGGRTSLLILTGAVVLVLLIGCANVANLMLVRSERRQREMAVRTALGAGRGSLMATFVLEGLALAALAVVVGLGLAWACLRLLLALYGDGLPRAESIGLSWPMVLFAVALALLTGLLVGLVPALRLDPGALGASLRQGGHGSSSSTGRLQRLLVAAEVALAVVLVAGAGLLIHSFWKLQQVDTGVDPADTLVFRVELPQASYEEEGIAQFFDRALEEIGRLPRVEHVGISPRVPLQGGANITSMPSPVDPEIEASFVEIRQVSPDFFDAAGIPLLRGRGFTEAEAQPGSDVVVISDGLAETLFPDREAVGEFLVRQGDRGILKIVGVVEGVREFGVDQAKRPAVYWPYPSMRAEGAMVFVVRTEGDPLELLPEIRSAISRLDPTLPLYGIRTLEEVVIETVGQRWFATNLLVAFGVLALALAALGIFGLLAYVVEQRTREIGIRMALGANRGTVAKRVVGEGLKLVLPGLVLGCLVALAASRLLSDLLYEVEPTDPWTLILVAALVLAVSALAAFLPARRASRLPPVLALAAQ